MTETNKLGRYKYYLKGLRLKSGRDRKGKKLEISCNKGEGMYEKPVRKTLRLSMCSTATLV